LRGPIPGKKKVLLGLVTEHAWPTQLQEAAGDFSNPTLFYQDELTGDFEEADNARVIRENM